MITTVLFRSDSPNGTPCRIARILACSIDVVHSVIALYECGAKPNLDAGGLCVNFGHLVDLVASLVIICLICAYLINPEPE